jgi:class 3 adenylate cyclase
LSGFTKLTEQLAVHPHGAELLCQALDQVYALLLVEADKWGGDAVKFAGDAILFCWPVTAASSSETDHAVYRAELALCCARAVRCSDAVHKLIQAHPPVAGVQLTLHAGLCAGPLACCVLGGGTLQPRRFEFVVCGAPLAQLALSEPAAKPGETVLSPDAAALVADTGLCRLEAIRAPNPAAGYFRLKGKLPTPQCHHATQTTTRATPLLKTRNADTRPICYICVCVCLCVVVFQSQASCPGRRLPLSQRKL